MLTGWALASGAVLTASAVLVARLATGGRVISPPGSWPPSLTRLVDDVQDTALDRIALTALTTALIPLVIGALLVGTGWAIGIRPRAAITAPPVRGPAAGASCAALAGVVLVPLGLNHTTIGDVRGAVDALNADRPARRSDDR
ncbi:hypothetical protein NRF20_39935 [Streptomyces sp. R-74717]|uniref:hypothetical protein n=1 Tax=Streptomyces TaxID=1883 RepID=UPI0037996A2D